MDRSSKQKINKETEALKNTIDQLDLIDIYRTFHPETADYTFFSSAHGTSSRIDHTLGHKSSLSKFKKIEIISSIFSDHNAMRLEINYREKNVKITNTWRLNNTLLNNQEITEEVKEEIKKYLERASLVAQWLRVRLPMRGTRVRALVWEDPTCHRAAGPVSHNC